MIGVHYLGSVKYMLEGSLVCILCGTLVCSLQGCQPRDIKCIYRPGWLCSLSVYFLQSSS